MAILLSTGLKNYIVSTGSIQAALTNKVLSLYDLIGDLPTSADQGVPSSGGISATILRKRDFTGITYATASGGVLVPDATLVDSFQALSLPSAVLAVWRIHSGSDTQNTFSSTAIRCQGTIGGVGSGADLIIHQGDLINIKLKTLNISVVGNA
jgi:hypothetical protein